MSDEELAEIRARDAEAQCVSPSCHRTAADRRVLLARLDRLQQSYDNLVGGFSTALEWQAPSGPEPHSRRAPHRPVL